MKFKAKYIWFPIIIGLLAWLIAFIIHLYYYSYDPRISTYPKSTKVGHARPTAAESHNLVTLLSIDGGGTRGVIPLYLLSKIEAATNKRARTSFDLIGGVSTGALIASALSIPNKEDKPLYSADVVLSKYLTLSDHIFAPNYLRNIITIDGIIAPKYDARKKYDFLDQYFHSYTLNDLLGNLLLIGVDSAHNKILTFCNWQNCCDIPYEYPFTSIISGITSPYSFFAPQVLFNREQKIQYILHDAGLIVANPALLTYVFGKDLYPNAHYYFLLSLGTGTVRDDTLAKESVAKWGALHWLPHIITQVISGQRNEIRVVIKKLNRNELIYIRINPSIVPEHSSLFRTDRPHFHYALSVAEKTYSDHQPLFQCIDEIITKRVISPHCQTILSHYQEHEDR